MIDVQIKKRNQIYDLTFALVFTTRNNQAVFDTAAKQHTITNILTQLGSAKHLTIHRVNIQPNYVYMLLSIPPTMTLSTVVKNLKAVSARHWFNQCQPTSAQRHLWANGYYIATSGQPDGLYMHQQLSTKKGKYYVKKDN